MAVHELYVGGPSTANYSRAMFPAPAFVAAAAAFQAVTPSAHKGPTAYQLGRVLDFKKDLALAEYVRNHVVAAADVLGSILVPKNTLFKGMSYWVEREAQTAAGAPVVVTITPSLRSGGAFPAIAAGTLNARGWSAVAGSAWQSANGSVADVPDGTAYWIQEPTVIDLTLTALPAETDLTNLRLHIIPVVDYYATGEF